MEKAYDIKDLGKRLEKAGVAQGEVAAAKIYEVVKGWAADSARISKTPLDDLMIPYYKHLDAIVYPQIDKISDEVKTTPND